MTTTTTLNHRPAPFIAAAAAVAAIAAGALTLSLAHDSSHPSAPGQQSPLSAQHDQHQARHYDFPPTSSGGHVMLGN